MSGHIQRRGRKSFRIKVDLGIDEATGKPAMHSRSGNRSPVCNEPLPEGLTEEKTKGDS